MKSVKFILPAALALAGIPTPASAGIYTDDLSKCVVRATTASDKQLLMKWMFSAFSSNPAIASLSKVAPGDHESFDKSMALIVERLLLSDCRKEAIDAIKYEGGSAIENSFNVLGEVAVRDLMSEPNTSASVGKFARSEEHTSELQSH